MIGYETEHGTFRGVLLNFRASPEHHVRNKSYGNVMSSRLRRTSATAQRAARPSWRTNDASLPDPSRPDPATEFGSDQNGAVADAKDNHKKP